MTLRIERLKGRVRLSGEFRFGQTWSSQDRNRAVRIASSLDLEELDLIDLEGVRFLDACEAKGISVVHCSPYIREWMFEERARPHPAPLQRA